MSHAETIANAASRNSMNALKRLEQHDKTLRALVNAVNVLQPQLSQAVEVLNAVVAVLDPDIVGQKVKELQRERQQQEADLDRARVAALLSQGILKAADKISDSSLIVGREVGKDGEVVFPGRQQVTFSEVMPELKEKILGQGVGFKLETPSGNTFEVTEIYDVQPKPPDTASEATATAPGAP